MRKQLLTLFSAASFGLSALLCHAQPYSNAVTALSPIAYWPLNETATPPAAAVATNLGSLGSAFNAPFGGDVTFGLPGALSGETADGFEGNGYVQTPYTTAISNAPSFTVEAWLLAHDVTGGDTYCALSAFSGTRSGWLLYLNINNGGQYNFRTYDGVDTAASINLNVGAAGSIAKDTWNHVVIVVSNAVTATNVYAYLNGVLVTNGAVGGLGYHPDDGASGGFAIGERADGGFRFKGGINQVAYYPSALDATTIAAHYTAATTSPSTYATTVQAASPLLYFPLSEPNNLPIAHNYGSLGAVANGYYQSGTVPGVPGPSFAPFGNGFGGSDFATQFSPSGVENNTNPGPGVVCGTSNLAALDDTNSITVSAWVKVPAGPVGWFTGVLGRGDSSYRMAVDQNGNPHFADGGNGDIVGADVVNDGNWHQWVGVYDLASSNAALYIDSQLVGTALWNPPGGNTEIEFYIGGAPDYDGRNFVGSIAQVAVYNKVLTSSDIQATYYSTAPSPFELAVSALKPAGYWPLQETVQPPAAPTIPAEVNLGTVGSSLDGVIGGDLIYGVPGALASTTDSADAFSGVQTGGGAITQIQSPYTQDLANGPSFSIEAWLKEDNLNFTQCALSDIDANDPRSGWLIYQDITAPGEYTFRAYNQNSTTPSLSFNIGPAGSITNSVWYHLVVVVSNAVTVTNVYGYLDGQLVAGPTPLPAYVPNDGTQGGFTVGARTDLGFHWSGAVDEVAYYTNALTATAVLSHYQAGTNPSPATAYETLVQAEKPIVYYRFDEAPAGSPFVVPLPVAVNYGSTGTNATGYYQPGLIPGIDGPTNSGLGPVSLGVNFDSAAVAGTVGAGPGILCDPYDTSAINPSSGFSLACWVRATNGWFETVLGAGDSSYRLDFDASGLPHFAASPNGDIVGPNSVGDGLWHFWQGVYDNVKGEGYLYIDGLVVASAPWQDPAPIADYLLIGGAPDYVGRNFSGDIAHVAIFTNALTAAEAGALYASIGVAPGVAIATNSVYINQGGNGTIAASVSGTAPLTEQWFYTSGAGTFAATNGTSDTLALTDVGAGQNGWAYFLVVSNSYGVVTGAQVTLNVVQGPPTIQSDITPPLSYAPVGVSDAFTVLVTGSQPFFYHWYVNGSTTPIPGATNSSYAFTVLTGSNIYTAQISNAFGPVTSSSAAVVGLTGAPSVISFANAATDWTTNANPNAAQQVPELTPTTLVLTDGTNGEVSSAWYDVPQYIGGFIAKYTFAALPGNSTLADGSSFTIQNSSAGLAAIAGGGGDLGIYGLNHLASFITDLYNISGGGIGFSTNGQTGGGTDPVISYIPTTPVGIELGDPINIRLFFSEGTLYVLLVDTVTGATFQDSHYYGDIVSIVGGASAYVGFTGSTGGVASIQEVSNFEFSSTTPPVLTLTAGANDTVVITWPVSVSTMFTLVQSGSVTGPWQPLGGSTVVNGQNQLTVSAAGSSKFYQLILQ
jgi:hypothetical protein